MVSVPKTTASVRSCACSMNCHHISTTSAFAASYTFFVTADLTTDQRLNQNLPHQMAAMTPC